MAPKKNKVISRFYLLLVSFLFLSPIASMGQIIEIKSSQNHAAVPFVQTLITSHSGTIQLQSDKNGKLKLEKEFTHNPLQMKLHAYGFKTKEIENFILVNDTVILLEPLDFDLNEVVITAQYQEQLIEDAVHDIKILDRNKIETMTAQNLKEVLHTELNIRLGEDMVLGSTIKIQGVGGQNVKILIDGVPLTGRQDGNIDLSQILTENIERIEIVEGPLSVNYGTDALAGTINIVTKKSQENTFEFTSNNYLESTVKVNNSVGVGWKINNKHQIRAEAGRHFFDGWNPTETPFYSNPNPVADSSRVHLWNPKEQIFGRASYRMVQNKLTLDYGGDFFNENILNRGYPRAPYQETAFDDYYQTQRVNQRLNIDLRLNKNYRAVFLAGYDGYLRTKNTKVRDLTKISDVLSMQTSDHDTSRFHSFMSRGRYIQTLEKLNYEAGFDLVYEIATGEKVIDKKQAIGDYALYATAEWSPIQTLTIRPGVRYGYNTEYKAPLTPSLNVKYSFFEKGKNKWTLRSGYARGFRSPSIKELHYEFVDVNHDIVGNPNLNAEYSNHYNFSLTHIHKSDVIKTRTRLGGFYSDINELITLAQNPASATQYTYFNLDRFTSAGMQMEGSLNYNHLSTTLGFAYIGRKNHLPTGKNHLLYSPEVNLNLQYSFEKIGVTLAGYYKYTGVLPNLYADEDGEIVEGLVHDYHIADITASKSWWQNRIKLTVGVKNLLDVTTIATSSGVVGSGNSHSTGINYLPIGMGRTYHVGIKFQIHSK